MLHGFFSLPEWVRKDFSLHLFLYSCLMNNLVCSPSSNISYKSWVRTFVWKLWGVLKYLLAGLLFLQAGCQTQHQIWSQEPFPRKVARGHRSSGFFSHLFLVSIGFCLIRGRRWNKGWVLEVLGEELACLNFLRRWKLKDNISWNSHNGLGIRSFKMIKVFQRQWAELLYFQQWVKYCTVLCKGSADKFIKGEIMAN